MKLRVATWVRSLLLLTSELWRGRTAGDEDLAVGAEDKERLRFPARSALAHGLGVVETSHWTPNGVGADETASRGPRCGTGAGAARSWRGAKRREKRMRCIAIFLVVMNDRFVE